MINGYEVKKSLRDQIANGTLKNYLIKSDDTGTEYLYHTLDESGDMFCVCSIEEIIISMRKKQHCDFECIYSDHGSLFNVLRCKECGAIIFEYDDERYDPNLECPICGKYNTSFMYYTQEEIEKDERIKNEIELYKHLSNLEEASNKRYIARGELYDWQLCKKEFYTKNKKTLLVIEFRIDSITNKFKLKGLSINIDKFGQNESHPGVYQFVKSHYFPLSIYAIRQMNIRKWIMNHKDHSLNAFARRQKM